MSTEEKTPFQKAVDEVNNLKKKPSDEVLLDLYGLYKQATIGNVNINKPGFTDLKGRAKWFAWQKYENTSKEDAEEQYIAYVEELKKPKQTEHQ